MTKMPELPEPAAHLVDYSPVFSESQLIRYAKQYGRDLLEEAEQAAVDAVAFNGGTVQTEAHVRQAIRAMKETI